MRILLASLVVLSASLAHAEDSITLGSKVSPVGTKLVQEKMMTLDMTVTLPDGKKVPVSLKETQKKKTEVLEVKDDTIVKAKITYEDDSKVEKNANKEKGGPTVVKGKTYTLTAGSPTKVEIDSKEAPAAEATLVRDHEKRFGQPDRMRKVLGGKKFVKGTAVDLMKEGVGEVFGADGKDTELTAMTLTYTGMAGKLAKFDMTVGLSAKAANMQIDLKGKVTVDPKTGELLDLDMSGPVKGTAKVAFDGTMKMRMRQK
jgi:hypothetical protein